LTKTRVRATTKLTLSLSIRGAARNFCYEILIQHLKGLLDHQNDLSADEMLSVATASEDTNLHNAIYTFLYDCGEIERMVRIKSPKLESWLQHKDADLLWRFYIVHEKHGDAAALMSSRAIDERNGLSLDDRITCLTRSVMASEEGGGNVNNVIQVSERSERALMKTRKHTSHFYTKTIIILHLTAIRIRTFFARCSFGRGWRLRGCSAGCWTWLAAR